MFTLRGFSSSGGLVITEDAPSVENRNSDDDEEVDVDSVDDVDPRDRYFNDGLTLTSLQSFHAHFPLICTQNDQLCVINSITYSGR